MNPQSKPDRMQDAKGSTSTKQEEGLPGVSNVCMQNTKHLWPRSIIICCKYARNWQHVSVRWCARVACCAILDDEFCLPGHAKEDVVVVVAARDLANALPDGVLIREVKRRASHGGYLPCRNGSLVQRCVVVPVYDTDPNQANIILQGQSLLLDAHACTGAG